jgi:DNA polymerase-1
VVGGRARDRAGSRGLCSACASRGRRSDLGGEAIPQIPLREALDLLKAILEEQNVLKIVQNAKFDMVALARYGIALASIDDPCLMSYALDAGRAEHLPGELAGRLLGYTCLTEKDVLGSGRSAVAFDRVEVPAPPNMPAKRPISACGSG